jgi:hypothetical protein
MKKLKIGYWPLSSDLKSAGDRRRVVFWAQARGHEVVTNLNQSVDVIIASERSDFNSYTFSKRKTPVIFDLIDAYLSPMNFYDDFARGLAKKFSGQISGEIKPFSHHVKDFCLNADGVICSSVEQEEIISRLNLNTHVILDSHSEIPFIEPAGPRRIKPEDSQILWEGQPATIRGVGQISSTLMQLNDTNKVLFKFVTDEFYYQFLGKYVKRSTSALLERDLRSIFDKIEIIPWAPSNLVEVAQKSSVAMIPIDLSVPMQLLKPENRLLIMWRLGLPCLTSPSPAYVRVSNQAGVKSTCANSSEWLINFNHLLENPQFAHEEVLRGQNYLRERHSEKLLLQKWDLAIESVLG